MDISKNTTIVTWILIGDYLNSKYPQIVNDFFDEFREALVLPLLLPLSLLFSSLFNLFPPVLGLYISAVQHEQQRERSISQQYRDSTRGTQGEEIKPQDALTKQQLERGGNEKLNSGILNGRRQIAARLHRRQP